MLELTREEFENLAEFVKVNYGINLSSRKAFVEMRLQKLMDKARMDRFSEYFSYVCNDTTGVVISDFISSLTINYTLFYREAYHFDFLNTTVLPALYRKEQSTKDLRVWSAGCATGEEPYTLAMIIADFLGIHKSSWDMKILATDISSFALKKGLAGHYARDSIGCLKPHWVRDYFMDDATDSDQVCVAPAIRDEVIFRRFNLVGDSFNFKRKFHFIFCRNVMIYFDEPTRIRLINKFYDILEEGGYLFIGMSETIDKDKTDFTYVMPSVYRKGGSVE